LPDSPWLPGLLWVGALIGAPVATSACEGPVEARATLAEIADFARDQGRGVLTFTGYSGAE
jgi:hypothetical protein